MSAISKIISPYQMLLLLLAPAALFAQVSVSEVEVPVVINKPGCDAASQAHLKILNPHSDKVRYVLRSRPDADHWFIGAERNASMSLAAWDSPIPPVTIEVSCQSESVTSVTH